MKLSRHCSTDRLDRLVFIATELGWGEVVLQVSMGDKWECVTDTGVILVKSKDEKLLITAYPATIEKTVALFHSVGEKVPASLKKVIQKNRKKIEKAHID